MGRYPAQPLEEKLAWMRERQLRKAEAQAKPIAVAPSPLPPARAEETPAQRKMMRVPEVAEELSVSESSVRRWCAKRAVVIKEGRRHTTMPFSRRGLEDWKREHTGVSLR